MKLASLKDTVPSVRMKPFNLILALTTLTSPACSESCILPSSYNKYLEEALAEAKTHIDEYVVLALDDIGLASFGDSLPITSIIDFGGVFTDLFGDEVERHKWLTSTADTDVLGRLKERVETLAGTHPELTVTCELVNTVDLEEYDDPYRFALEVDVFGNLTGGDIDLATLGLDPKVAVLPEDIFPPLDLTIDALSASYRLNLPLTIDLRKKNFMIGELKIEFDASFSTSLEQSIPISGDVSQTFEGNLVLDAALKYSSIQDWSYTGTYEASLTAETLVGTNGAIMGLIARDDDLFDEKPPVVVFDFDICEYVDLLQKSVQSISFDNEISTMIDKHFGPVLEKTFLPQTFADPLKAAIATAASNKVNSVRNAIVSKIVSFVTECSSRRLGTMEIAQDESQRMLQQDLTFSALSVSVQGFPGVVSCLLRSFTIFNIH